MTLGVLEYAVRRPVPYSTRKLGDGAALASVLVGVAAVLFLAVHGHRSIFVIPAWACIQLAAMKWGDWRRLKSVPGGALLAMALLWTVGAAGATVWGHGESTMSWTLAVFGWLLVAVYATPIAERLFTVISLGAYPHAVVAIWQGLWSQQRALGFAGDQNVAAGFLGVAVVYLAARGRWYVAAPLIPAMAATASRLAWWTMIGMLIVMALHRTLTVRQVAFLAAVAVASVLVFLPTTERLVMAPEHAVTMVREETESRVSTDLKEPPFKVLPMGYPGDDSPHSAPVQLYYQGGVTAVLAALLFVAWGLWRNRGSPTWWVLVFLLGVSTLDFYAVMPPVSLLTVAAVSAEPHG